MGVSIEKNFVLFHTDKRAFASVLQSPLKCHGILPRQRLRNCKVSSAFRWTSVPCGAYRWIPAQIGGCRRIPVVSGANRWFPAQIGGFRRKSMNSVELSYRVLFSTSERNALGLGASKFYTLTDYWSKLTTKLVLYVIISERMIEKIMQGNMVKIYS